MNAVYCIDSCVRLQSSMLQSLERYFKQAIVDKEPSVASAALTSALVRDDSVIVDIVVVRCMVWCMSVLASDEAGC